MSNYLFVYGTLSPSLAPKEIEAEVRKLEFVGDGLVSGKLYDLGAYPGLILTDEIKKKVRGKVYRLPADKKVIRSLDSYEEYFPRNPKKSLYRRRLTKVQLADGRELKTWIYEYNGATAKKKSIPSGVYRKALA